MKEESITDLHLLAFSEARIDGFRVWSIGRREERRIGADFEWWFGDRYGNWTGIRVQAKRLGDRGVFRQLHYQPRGAAVTQAEALLDSCLKFKMLPAYCLYLYSDAYLKPSFGCSLLSPLLVSSFPADRVVPLSRIHRALVPWSVLVCPDWWPGFIESGNPLSEVARIGWGEAMETGHAEFGGDKESRRGWTTAFLEAALTVEPPSYVLRMIETDLDDPEPAWQAELRERDVDGALIIEAE